MNHPKSKASAATRNKAIAKARGLWMQAFREGRVTLSFPETSEGELQAKNIYKFLCNTRTLAKRKPLENLEFSAQVRECRLSRPMPNIVHIERRTLNNQVLHTYNVMLDILPETKEQTAKPSTQEILKKFRKNFTDSCTK